MDDKKLVKNKSKTVYSKRFQYQWFDDNPSWRNWVKEVPNEPSKFFCKACKAILACGVSEIKKHSRRESHLKNMKAQNLDCNISNFEITNRTSSIETVNLEQSEMIKSLSHSRKDFDFNDRVKIAELRLATFFVEKNVSFTIISDLLSLMKDIGNEHGILQTMYLEKKKLTQITNNVCHEETNRITKVLREHKFSIYENETSDKRNGKWLSLMVRYIEPKTLNVRCELLQMIHLDAIDCSASKIFKSFKNELLKKNISLRSIVSLACDNASATAEDKNCSFKTILSAKNPDLVILPCVCHSSMVAAKEACKILPRDCEHFIKGISTFISGSSKKTAIFRDFITSFDEKSSLTILKYAEMSWQMRHKFIQRILEMWNALGNFLMEQTCKNIRPTDDDLISIFRNPTTKAYFFFLEFTLDAFNKYNAKFQTRNTVIHELQTSSMELLFWFLKKFIKPNLLLLDPEISCNHTVRNLNFSDPINQLSLEEIDFGVECNEYLQGQLNQGILSETDISLVREYCLQFYVKASEHIRNHLPVDDTFLQLVNVFASRSALFDCDRNSTFRKVLQVKRRLCDVLDEDSIENEWKFLYEIDPRTKNELSKLSFDDMWMKIGFFSTNDERNESCFPNLRSLLSVVRALPHSNAETKRAISVIPDANTRKRNDISTETLNSICVIKYALKNNNSTARTMTVTREHLDLITAENIL
ncbi:PREDICTED: uncharacterized protein LOC106748603 [Dinoponera quadriceps]|uniref:Uncharacterized protein LOC106748603 n=1 Tax=Dinoponera quadriceps TaxID=609295 RepID=A0A6P3XXG7_DINQU|nr:PREDICTED: uncharacterized protein LOC106748603 [Dinoponera quadriceps]XP_014482783.1 PREDICTED: uncharacterized protein LOC106748603 [Dinoponera quadriceps]